MIPVVPEVKVQSSQSLPAGELDCLSCRIVGTAAFTSGTTGIIYSSLSLKNGTVSYRFPILFFGSIDQEYVNYCIIFLLIYKLLKKSLLRIT